MCNHSYYREKNYFYFFLGIFIFNDFIFLGIALFIIYIQYSKLLLLTLFQIFFQIINFIIFNLLFIILT